MQRLYYEFIFVMMEKEIIKRGSVSDVHLTLQMVTSNIDGGAYVGHNKGVIIQRLPGDRGI